jgi:hypothetical protein
MRIIRHLVVLGCSWAATAAELPEGTLLEIRMNADTGTRISRQGDPVSATLIAPVAVDGVTVLASGVQLEGSIGAAKRLGWNPFRHTAAIEYVFDRVVIDGWLRLPIETRLISVDTAREHVDGEGRVHGIRPAANVSSGLAAYGWRLALLEPPLAMGVWATKFAFARPPDPEIYFPKGTEMILRVTAPITVPSVAGGPAVAIAAAEKLERAAEALAAMPSQRATTRSGQLADVLNVALLGSETEVRRAFLAAGWAETEKKTAGSLMRTYRSIIERRSYRSAPMSTMTLGGVPAQLSFQKGLNSFARRHHIRLWRRPTSGGDVWIGAATEDISIGFSFKKMNWTHFIDQRIDGERAKVANDLAFTGCVDAASYVERAELPGDLAHDSGQIQTDGKVVVIQLNSCGGAAPAEPVAGRPSAMKRFLHGAHHELVRSNFLHIGYHATRLASAVSHLWTRRPASRRPEPVLKEARRINAGAETSAVMLAPPDSATAIAMPGGLEPEEIGEGSSGIGKSPDQDADGAVADFPLDVAGHITVDHIFGHLPAETQRGCDHEIHHAAGSGIEAYVP